MTNNLEQRRSFNYIINCSYNNCKLTQFGAWSRHSTKTGHNSFPAAAWCCDEMLSQLCCYLILVEWKCHILLWLLKHHSFLSVVELFMLLSHPFFMSVFLLHALCFGMDRNFFFLYKLFILSLSSTVICIWVIIFSFLSLTIISFVHSTFYWGHINTWHPKLFHYLALILWYAWFSLSLEK